MSNKIKENNKQIPVLIAGGGLTGLSAALFLLQQGIHPVLIERRSGTSIHPRARGFDVRTMELFRELQLDHAIREAGQSLSAAWGIYAGADLPAIVDQVPTDRAKIKHPIEIPGLEKIAALSPVSGARCTQDLGEPILLQAAIDRGADIRFDTELVSFTQDTEGITAYIRDRNTNETTIVHCQYLIAADGGNSPIRRHLGAETTGNGALGNLLNIYFEAPLGDYVKGREFSIGLINRPGITGMFTAINNSDRWVLHLHYDPKTERPEDFTTARLESILHDIIRLPEVPVRIISMLPWQPTVKVVNNMQYGRLFLAGDAAHQMTPYGGKGAASGVQDVHNLAWKLALVLKQQAHPTLLDTYSPERQPVGLKNALTSGEMADEKGLLKADALTAFKNNPDKEKAFAWLLSMLGIPDYRYTSNAIAGATHIADTGLVKAGGHPGTRVPHHWLHENDTQISTLDLAVTHFTLVTDEAGAHWHSAVTAMADNFRMPISVKVITAPEWKTAANLATGDALLIRPDGFVAWHSADGTYTLEQALSKILGVAIHEEQKA
ncbi:MAG: FAD-dependent monooxygenase [Chitinophaga sp.]|uniref:FAD-dependent monooxygenase n=1 Tax=Chitinophaga sp. TaxID=1869181 RepID=UPI001B12910B|nr:FAD-dependent monooxygenase [Chitinophaga sp.]MBO9727393.1 FAD-dependent monooxygenase [Chitinophaga sp.]